MSILWHDDWRGQILLVMMKLTLKLSHDRQSVGQSILVSGSHLELMTRFLFLYWQLRISWCVAPSLMREWVCNLFVQFLLRRAVALGYESRRTHDRILLSHLRISPTWRTKSPYLYLPVTRWPRYTPGYWISFSSPLATQRATVEVF
jgi:hypothetical protein